LQEAEKNVNNIGSKAVSGLRRKALEEKDE
jgi:hypothetical protein